jgi:hypothetical protein
VWGRRRGVGGLAASDDAIRRREEHPMASQRTTFNKLQRERAKKAKSAAKRERRQQRSEAAEEATAAPEASVSTLTVPELLERIERLHARFDAGGISFEDFEEQRAELYEQLSQLPMD